ncbi:GDP-L-fucose synthase family protein [Cohaesibacter celericrescens]|uniref:GDP-L-fucose synthase n=1 Tax=Cohaesibacter celericrescens TaxID=2067669 RepID=A0A2N5XTL5_9HYPH|nr:GDP-L-fucose synthase [Cohaesibacter celericrescens]PLW77843.1 GDP-fucose synthetase [Cohaesibacter celericrescens]
MRIFLTGGAGMVGRNFLESPLNEGHEIFAPSSAELDLRDYDALHQYLQKTCPDYVVHCAGKVGGINANIREPVGFLVENLDIGRNVIMASKNAGVKRLLNLGSSCMYPRNYSSPLREEMILSGELEPTNEGYALAKIVAARLCDYISREDEAFQYKTLVPCNIYGRHDKFDPKNSHMVPAIIHKLHLAKQNNISEVDIWGDGHARREFLYAGDLSDCMWRALVDFEHMPQVMNVGLGMDYSVNEYYEKVAEVIGYTGHFTHDLSKPVGMKQKLVDVTKSSTWGWQAATSLQEGIALTYDFYLEKEKL